jgi:flagellar hook-length control protein FliK
MNGLSDLTSAALPPAPAATTPPAALRAEPRAALRHDRSPERSADTRAPGTSGAGFAPLLRDMQSLLGRRGTLPGSANTPARPPAEAAAARDARVDASAASVGTWPRSRAPAPAENAAGPASPAAIAGARFGVAEPLDAADPMPTLVALPLSPGLAAITTGQTEDLAALARFARAQGLPDDVVRQLLGTEAAEASAHGLGAGAGIGGETDGAAEADQGVAAAAADPATHPDTGPALPDAATLAAGSGLLGTAQFLAALQRPNLDSRPAASAPVGLQAVAAQGTRSAATPAAHEADVSLTPSATTPGPSTDLNADHTPPAAAEAALRGARAGGTPMADAAPRPPAPDLSDLSDLSDRRDAGAMTPAGSTRVTAAPPEPDSAHAGQEATPVAALARAPAVPGATMAGVSGMAGARTAFSTSSAANVTVIVRDPDAATAPGLAGEWTQAVERLPADTTTAPVSGPTLGAAPGVTPDTTSAPASADRAIDLGRDPHATDLAEQLADRIAAHLGREAARGALRAFEGERSRDAWTLKLALRPAELGPVQVELRLQDGQIAGDFSSASASTRQLLQDGLGRLREQLQAHGMDVAEMGVNGGNDGRFNGNPTPRQNARPTVAAGETGRHRDAAEVPASTVRPARPAWTGPNDRGIDLWV